LATILDRLERDGFVTGSRVRQKERPDKTVFRLTKPGRLELDAWLSRPFIGRGGFRDDFFLKLFVASRLGPDRLREVARTQREIYLAELASLGNLRRQHREEPLVSLLIKAAVLQTEANLKVVGDADDQAEQLAMASGGARATQLTQDAKGETAPPRINDAGAAAVSSSPREPHYSSAHTPTGLANRRHRLGDLSGRSVYRNPLFAKASNRTPGVPLETSVAFRPRRTPERNADDDAV